MRSYINIALAHLTPEEKPPDAYSPMHYIFAIKMHMHVKHFLAFIMQGWNFILKKSNDYMTGGMGEKFISLLMVDNYCYYKYFIQYDFFTLPKTPEVFVTFCCPENI